MRELKLKIARRWLQRNKWKIAKRKKGIIAMTPKFRRQLIRCSYTVRQSPILEERYGN